MSRSLLSNVVRRKFIEYFVNKHDHTYVGSSSVIPRSDKSLSFVNAGMNQFKDLFLADQPQYSPSRVCNYQKCIRVGGKSCDLNQVGRDLRHHTFFEMLGNWSFNDYGKAQTCEWALDFLVNHLNINLDKLFVTYYASDTEEDTETKAVWLNLGLKPDRVVANFSGDNFWEMGNSGPCGMSTEIFYSLESGPLEIWNLVFIDRQRLNSETGEVAFLKGKFVDTGMGLERILSVLEGVDSNYDTDLFKPLFEVVTAKSNAKPYSGSVHDELDVNYRIIVDHCRMITIALADGVIPGRKGNSFNLRRMIKKCVSISKDVFHQQVPRYLLFDLVDETIRILSDAYPELPEHVKHIRRTLAHESKRHLAASERYLQS